MDGLCDAPLRDLLTRIGGVDVCVSEFIRVSGQLLPDEVFLRFVPEMSQGGCTPAGVPVRAQLMGSDEQCLAENAAKLAALGPAGIDLNFGCPANTVNKHRGGAVLLDEPELVGRLVSAVRRVVPPHLPVTAKMRLGYKCDTRTLDCAAAIEAGGAAELVVHARTKLDGYRPPAYWEKIAAVRAAVRIPVIANGEIWTVEDATRCRAVSGCDELMLGRGLVADPGLARAIASDGRVITDWEEVAPLVAEYWRTIQASLPERSQTGRMKQWLKYLRLRFPEGEAVFFAVRLLLDPHEVDPRWFEVHG